MMRSSGRKKKPNIQTQINSNMAICHFQLSFNVSPQCVYRKRKLNKPTTTDENSNQIPPS